MSKTVPAAPAAAQAVERLDPALVAAAPALVPLGLDAATLPAIRASLDQRRADAARGLATGAVTVEAATLTLADRAVGLRVYRGTAARRAPALLYLHSGAYVLGNLDTDHARCVALAREAGCVVVSVDYRLAPEHPYPAALDDATAALAALHAAPAGYGVDPGRVAVGGNSAGAGLAAAVALRARDTGGPPLRFQLLHQPMLDHRCGTPSMREFTGTPGFDAASARFAWSCYAGDGSPYASPTAARSLAGLPPAYVSCSEIDPLRDEAIAYAWRLMEHGVPTELHVHPGTCHGFDSLAPSLSRSTAALSAQARALAHAFARPDCAAAAG